MPRFTWVEVRLSLASILGVLAFDFFFVPPYLTLVVSDTEYLLTFLGLLSVSLVISQLMATVREQADAAQRREIQTVALYELGRDLTITTGLENVAQTVISRIDKTFDRDCCHLSAHRGCPERLCYQPWAGYLRG